MQRRSVPRLDARYKQIRVQNNHSVKKSREKARRQRDETIDSINQLEENNRDLIQNLQLIKQEYEQLQSLFKQHTGIDFDEVLSTESKPTSESKESSSKPVLTINTNEDKTSSKNELDAHNLDGSIVLINGVQYKIVGMNT